jgi:tagatose 1,6-diphosphate aldolase
VRARRVRGVIDSAILARQLGADLVKTEFPGWADTDEQREAAAAACAELDASLDVPWLLLSAGVGYETFAVQTEIAARAGSAGFIAGRAVWDAAASPDEAIRAQGIDIALDRLAALTAIVHTHGRPWRLRRDARSGLAGYPPEWYVDWHPQPHANPEPHAHPEEVASR